MCVYVYACVCARVCVCVCVCVFVCALGHLAACELCQVWLQIFSYHRVDGDQTEHAGLAHAALRVVITLDPERVASHTHTAGDIDTNINTHTHQRMHTHT